jgi:superfamily II DNA or RNA helicase
MSTAPTLRPYQVEMLDSIAKARASGLNRVLCKAATGLGKTVSFAALLCHPPIAAWLSTFPKADRKMLVIAHREELLFQSAEKIHRANPDAVVSIEQADLRASRYSDVVIASIQTLASMQFRRLKKLLAHSTFRIVVVDESQHAPARTYRTALTHLGFLPLAVATGGEENIDAADYDDVEQMTALMQGWDAVAPRDRLLVGVTATPNRSDAIGLGCVFQSLCYSYALKEAIDDGWLVPIVPWTVETHASLDAVGIARGDFNQKQLANAVNTPERNLLAVKAWQAHAAGLSTLAFTVDVAHAHDLADAFRAVGVPALAVSGETPKDERRAALAAYTRGDVQVIANCAVFTEGTDLPRTGCILMAKPTKSATLFEQCVGRGLRTFPGKTECIVLDMVDVSRKHSLQTAAVLYGLPPTLKGNGKNLRELADGLEALVEQYPGFDASTFGAMTLEQLQAKASTFDIWQVPSLGAFGNGRALTWIKVGDDHYRLSYPWLDGTEILAVQRDILGHYDVSITLQPSGGGPKRQRTIATEIPSADDAAGVAEKFVLAERRQVMKLTDRDASWRSKPASEKQIGLLHRLRVPVKAGLTCGAASDLINLAKARRV